MYNIPFILFLLIPNFNALYHPVGVSFMSSRARVGWVHPDSAQPPF